MFFGDAFYKLPRHAGFFADELDRQTLPVKPPDGRFRGLANFEDMAGRWMEKSPFSIFHYLFAKDAWILYTPLIHQGHFPYIYDYISYQKWRALLSFFWLPRWTRALMLLSATITKRANDLRYLR
jgi:hypothetical protein